MGEALTSPSFSRGKPPPLTGRPIGPGGRLRPARRFGINGLGLRSFS